MNKEKITTPWVHLELKEDILFATFRRHIVIDLEAARGLVKVRQEYTNNVPYPILVSDEGTRSMTKEGREYLASEEAGVNVPAGAFILNSVYAEFIANFWLKIAKPKTPARIFTDIDKAIKWLEPYKPKPAAEVKPELITEQK